MTTVCCSKKSHTVYRPRRPEKTTLFQVVKKHYSTWNRNSKEPVPRYVDNEFQKYLGCGILAKGFACAHCDGCQKDFLIAFSCKGRGICPSCNSRAMVETAAHLVDNVLPRLPFRQFVLSFPKRIRHYLETHTLLQAVLKIVVEEIRTRLIACSPAVIHPQIGAISFIQYFGNTLNYHPHLHLIVADGIFGGETGLQFYEAILTPDDIVDTQDCIQNRVLRLLCRRGFFSKEEVEKMLSYDQSGFSLDAKVRIESWDKDGLERLIRYCARPPFASENLRWRSHMLSYRFPKPSRTGQLSMQLEPLDFLERISRFIPYPRRHRRHYHGIFAPSSPMRKLLVASAQKRVETARLEVQEAVEKASRSWAKLIARIYEVDPLTCTGCGKKIKITAFITNEAQIHRILRGIGWPVVVPEFDPPYDLVNWDVCDLVPYTHDGFPEPEQQVHYDIGPDPPHCEDFFDSPHWED